MRKQTPFAILGILALLLISFTTVSARFIELPQEINGSVEQSASLDLTFTIKNTNLTTNLTNLSFELRDLISGANILENSTQSLSVLPEKILSGKNITATYTISIPSNQPVGVYKGNLTIWAKAKKKVHSNLSITINVTEAAPLPQGCTDPTANNTNSTPVISNNSLCTFSKILRNFCKTGKNEGSDIVLKSVKDKSDVKDKWEWKPLEKVEIDVKVKNDGNDDEDYVAELYFLDSSGKEVDLADDSEDLEEEFSIDEGERETITFNFDIDGDVEQGDYTLYVKVYQDDDEENECKTFTYKDESDLDNIKIEKKKHDVIVKEVDGQTTAKAGETVTFEVKIANVGRNDEDKVKVIAYNKDLGLLKSKIISDLDEGERDTVTMLVQIPFDALEKDYSIVFSTEFKYDDNDETFDDESDTDDDITHTISVLEGVSSDPSIGAKLVSDAVVGKELEVEIAVRNNGKTDGIFSITLQGSEDWSSEVSLSKKVLTLGAGETKSVIAKFKPTEVGNNKFTVFVTANGKNVKQDVAVNVSENTGFLTGAFASLGLGTAGIYLVGAIVLLAILILVVLIIKLVMPSKRVVRREF